MNSSSKFFRSFIVILVLLASGFYVSVTFLGEDWGNQVQYLFSLLLLVFGIILCAATLVVIYKLIVKIWEALITRRAHQSVEDEDLSNKD